MISEIAPKNPIVKSKQMKITANVLQNNLSDRPEQVLRRILCSSPTA